MILEFRDIHKSFGEKKVLTGVSFTAESGKAFGLLGRNGAGKTTSIRILMGVFPADSGQVLLDGKPLDYRSVGMGYLPEERGLYPKKKVLEQLTYFAQLKGMRTPDAVRSIDRWLERLGMTEYRNSRLDTLSKGNQQKIQLVTALAHDPEIIILDEPFSGLDPVNAMLLKDVVKEEIGRGKVLLFSSHQMSYIEEFCDAIAIINRGAVALTGELYQIKREYPRDRLAIRSIQRDAIAADLPGRCEIRENGELIVKLRSPEEKMDMIRALSEKYDLDEARVYEPSLNDIFVQYAGEQE